MGRSPRVDYDVRRARPHGNLEWDPPPTLADVEKTLNANLGQEIKVLGDLDI
jgi:hypothetical protein